MTLRLPNPLSAAVWAAFLLAALFPGAGPDRWFGAAVCVLGALVIYSMPSPWEARKPTAGALRFFLLLEVLYVVSALYSAGFNGAALTAASFVELLRVPAYGVFVVYLIRHFDDGARRALDWSAAGAPYVYLLFASADPQGYAAILCLTWLLFFSRLRLRWLHAAAALLVVVLCGERAAWAAAGGVLSAGFALLVYRGLSRGRARGAARWSVLLFALLAASEGVLLRALRVWPAAPPFSTEAVALRFIRRSPAFGWGPVDSAAIVGRSQYVFWTLKHGYFGAALIAGALALVGARLLRAARADAARFAGTAAFVGAVALLLTAGRFFESERLFFLTAAFAAAARGDER